MPKRCAKARTRMVALALPVTLVVLLSVGCGGSADEVITQEPLAPPAVTVEGAFCAPDPSAAPRPGDSQPC